VLQKLWWYSDETVFPPESFKRFLQVIQGGAATLPWNVSELTFNLADVRYAGIYYLALLLGWLVLANGFRQPRVWASLGLGFCCLILLSGIRFPARVAYPFVLILALAPLAGGFADQMQHPKSNPFRFAVLTALLCVISWATYTDFAQLRARQQWQHRMSWTLEAGFQKLEKDSPGMLYIPLLMHGFSEASFIEPFGWKELHKTIPTGWLAQSPVREPYLKSLGFDINSKFVPQLLGRKNVLWYFFASGSQINSAVLDPFMQYLNSHYGDGAGEARLTARIRMSEHVGPLVWLCFYIDKQEIKKY
jgi:hypothetical protein